MIDVWEIPLVIKFMWTQCNFTRESFDPFLPTWAKTKNILVKVHKSVNFAHVNSITELPSLRRWQIMIIRFRKLVNTAPPVFQTEPVTREYLKQHQGTRGSFKKEHSDLDVQRNTDNYRSTHNRYLCMCIFCFILSFGKGERSVHSKYIWTTRARPMSER